MKKVTRNVHATNLYEVKVKDKKAERTFMVMCEDSMPGPKFYRALRDAFDFHISSGDIPMEVTFEDLSLVSVNFIARAAGSTRKIETGSTVSLVEDGDRKLLVNTHKWAMMAGLEPKPEPKDDVKGKVKINLEAALAPTPDSVLQKVKETVEKNGLVKPESKNES